MIDLTSYNNESFKSSIGASKIKQVLWYYTNVFFFKSSLFPFLKLKIIILKWFGALIGPNVIIKPCVNIKYPWKLTIASNVWIGEKVWIDNLGPVNIEDHVVISQGAMLLTGNHNYKKKSFDLMVSSISLEQGVWIGAHAIVCPGVTCKKNSILTVNSVATANLDENKIYQGNPAMVTRERFIL